MQFVVLGFDGQDEHALGRRMAARAEHLALGERMKAEGKLLFAAAFQDDAGEKMVGSALICDFADRKELDLWLSTEPYVVQEVWEKVEVRLCKVAPFFSQKLE